MKNSTFSFFLPFPSFSGTCGLILVLGTALNGSSAHALPVGDPLPGPSGLGAIPTTETVAPGSFAASLNYEHVNLSDSPGRARFLPMANLSYGFQRGEIGAAYAHQDTDIAGFSTNTDYFTLHGKYRLYSSPNGLGAIAVGGHYYDFGSDSGIDLGNVMSLYATGSYDLVDRDNILQARVHAGVLGQRSRYPGDSTTFARPFVGGEMYLKPDLILAADFLAKHGDQVAHAYTASLRYEPKNKSLAAQIGVGKLRDDSKFFVGLTYSFGK